MLHAINKAKKSLKPTDISVMKEDGSVITERRGHDGFFVCDSDSLASTSGADDTDGVSNRRRKKVEHAKRMGFVVDLKPDLQIAQCSENLYLGSQDAANDFCALKATGITHIVNCATGVNDFFPKSFRYCHLNVLDLPSTQLKDYFYSVHDFINNAVQAGGKVFVHCNAGISRSSTFVLSYMMRFYGHSLNKALEIVRKVRPVIRPNDGFMQQLLMFEAELEEERRSAAKT